FHVTGVQTCALPIYTENSVWQFRIVIWYFANIMQQSSAFRMLDVQAQFSSHGCTEIGYLPGVLQQVLSIRRAVTHTTHHPNQLRMQSVNPQDDHCTLTDLNNLVFNLTFVLCYHFFNPCEVNPSIGHQSVQRQPGNLPTYQIKT